MSAKLRSFKAKFDHELSNPEDALLYLQAAIREGEDVFACALLDVYDVWFDVGPEAVTFIAAPPRPWLRAEEVRESGSYWWLEDDEYANPAAVYVMKSGTDGSCFASAGQLGWRQSRAMKELGGLWQRIPEPELPEGES